MLSSGYDNKLNNPLFNFSRAVLWLTLEPSLISSAMPSTAAGAKKSRSKYVVIYPMTSKNCRSSFTKMPLLLVRKITFKIYAAAIFNKFSQSRKYGRFSKLLGILEGCQRPYVLLIWNNNYYLLIDHYGVLIFFNQQLF